MKIIYADYMWNGSFIANNLQSVNELLGNYQMAVYQYNNPYVSGFVNLQPTRNIDSTVVKKVPVTAPHAGSLFDNEMNPLDYLDVSFGFLFH